MAGSGTAHLRSDEDVVLRVDGLVIEYKAGQGRKLQAVSNVSFDVREGETVGLVGESGCGKSSMAKAVLRLQPLAAGSITFDGQDLTALSRRELRRLRGRLQLVFQDPISSLNPRRRVKDIVTEGLSITRVPRPWEPRVDVALRAVGLDPEVVGDRHPTELSGGQCQRVAIARVLVLDPRLIVCDEPVSALDVSVQAQILNLLEDAKARYRLTMLFISHDLAVVKSISDRVIVMYLGKLCEIASADQLYDAPQHPYTQALLNAVPIADPFTPEPPMLVSGDLPSPLDPPSGCRFRLRCPRARERCAQEEPVIGPVGEGHYVACHYPLPLTKVPTTPGSASTASNGAATPPGPICAQTG